MRKLREVLETDWSFWVTQEWSDWFREGPHVREFHVIDIDFADARPTGQREVRAFLVGVGFVLQWDTAEGTT